MEGVPSRDCGHGPPTAGKRHPWGCLSSCGQSTMGAVTPLRDCSRGWPMLGQRKTSKKRRAADRHHYAHNPKSSVPHISSLKGLGWSECNPQQKYRKLRSGREGGKIWLNVSPEKGVIPLLFCRCLPKSLLTCWWVLFSITKSLIRSLHEVAIN